MSITCTISLVIAVSFSPPLLALGPTGACPPAE
jgi:hypothetical protein